MASQVLSEPAPPPACPAPSTKGPEATQSPPVSSVVVEGHIPAAL